MELIQNADDCTYAAGVVPTLVVDVRGDAVALSFNEAGARSLQL
jgi:hypothetical protein